MHFFLPMNTNEMSASIKQIIHVSINVGRSRSFAFFNNMYDSKKLIVIED